MSASRSSGRWCWWCARPPLNLIQLRNMTAAAEAGAVILPAMPAFYQKPQTFDDLGDFIAGRVCNMLRIEHQLFPPWPGPAR